MSQKYAVPCVCGATVAVESRQAGDRVQCQKCSEFVDVPRLRELQGLEILDSPEVAPKSTNSANWSGLPGGLFAFGLLLIAIAGICAAFTFNTLTKLKEFATPPKTNVQVVKKDILNLTLLDSWDEWESYKKINLSTRPEPIHLQAKDRIALLNKFLAFFGVLATVGLLAILSSFFFLPAKVR